MSVRRTLTSSFGPIPECLTRRELGCRIGCGAVISFAYRPAGSLKGRVEELGIVLFGRAAERSINHDIIRMVTGQAGAGRCSQDSAFGAGLASPHQSKLLGGARRACGIVVVP